MTLPNSFLSRARRAGVLLLSIVALLSPANLCAAEPTKAEAVGVLRGLLAALIAQDYGKAITYFQMPPNATPDDLKKAASRLLELKEISGLGIDTLDAKGKWGKLAETVTEPGRAQRFAEKFAVPLAECYGLILGSAEAGFYWDGKQLKVIRCDDIGKLAP